jgi:hypothetical protein
MSSLAPQQPPRVWLQPLDRAAITIMVILGVVIVGLLWGGHQSKPKVRDFSWQSQAVGAGDTAFVLTFSRPMNHASVEQNLLIGPPLPGRLSWSGRRMVYTLNAPAPYGSQYQVTLQNAHEQFPGTDTFGEKMQAFSGQFQTRDRSFAYIGIGGDEDGRLVFYNLTRQRKSLMTPSQLVVQDFQIDTQGETIYVLASDRALTPDEQVSNQTVYRIDTASVQTPSPNTLTTADSISPPELILNNQDYINQKIQVAPDGTFLIVQRVKRNNPSDVGLWFLKSDEPPKRLNSEAGGEFLITADSQSIAIAQGQGVSLVSIASALEASTPNQTPQFLAKFAKVLDFSRDGRYAATIQFNANDYTRSLFVLDAQRGEKEYFKTKGSVLQAHFDPTGRYLYCLLTELIPGQTYREQPYFAVVDLQASKLQPLLLLPEQRELHVSLSPDGVALLFDQLILTRNAQPVPIRTAQPQRLPLLGLHPQWMP